MLTASRLRSANLLLVGMRALANEIAKNLMLAGIGSLTILDHHLVTEDDLGSQFFISELHVGMNVCTDVPDQRPSVRWRRRLLNCVNSELLLLLLKCEHLIHASR